MTDAIKTDDINYQNVAKVLTKILTKWGVSSGDSANLMGLTNEELSSLLEVGVEISETSQQRMAYLLNIHEQLKNLFGNDDNLPIFINTPNQAELFSGQVPLNYMVEQGLDGFKLILAHLESFRINEQ